MELLGHRISQHLTIGETAKTFSDYYILSPALYRVSPHLQQHLTVVLFRDTCYCLLTDCHSQAGVGRDCLLVLGFPVLRRLIIATSPSGACCPCAISGKEPIEDLCTFQWTRLSFQHALEVFAESK